MARNGWFDTEEEKHQVHYEDEEKENDLLIPRSKFAMPDWHKNELKESDRKDFILALSIIFSNLWRDEQYSYNLL